jgi:translation initiation factor 2 alpha subunit (eIF-2alpha)
MGSEVGVFDDDEVEELTKQDKKILKEHILHHIQTSPQIRGIISDKPKAVTGIKKIRDVLRKKAGKLQRRLKR